MTVLVVLLALAATALWPSRGRVRTSAATSPTTSVTSTPARRLSRFVAAVVADRLTGARPDAAPPAEVADAMVLIALALRAGLPLAAALHHVERASAGRTRQDLAAVTAALHWARPAGEAWDFAGPSWMAAALACEMAERTGAAPAALIEQAAARLKETQERERERKAARAGVLLVLPLGLGFLPAFACTAVIPVVLALAGGLLADGPVLR
jgi:pilus assembly protein TadC